MSTENPSNHDSDSLSTREPTRTAPTLEECSRHNESQPFPKLLPELLVQIIVHLRIIDPFLLPAQSVDELRASHSSTIGWVRITHVCRRLRHVALASGELWSDILCRPGCTRWLPDWLHRLGGAPVNFLYEGYKQVREHTNEESVVYELIEKMPQHLLRPRCIRVSSTRSTQKLLPLLFKRPAPFLEEFSMSWHVDDHHFCLIPSPWFSSEPVPQLRRLALTGFYFPWSALNFPHLTHLEIARPKSRVFRLTSEVIQRTELLWDVPDNEKAGLIEAILSPSVKALRDCLCRSPLLESLVLRYALPGPSSAASDWADIGPAVPLLRLRALNLTEGGCGRSDVFLNMIHAPQLEKLVITVVEPHLHLEAVRYCALIRSIASYVRRLGRPIQGLQISIKDYEWQVCATQWSTGQHDGQKPQELLHMTMCSTRFGGANASQRMSLIGLLEELPLDNLDTFDIACSANTNLLTFMFTPQRYANNVYADPLLWRYLFQRCSSAHTVRAESTAIIPLILLLASDDASGMPLIAPDLTHGPRIPAFPRLNNLSLVFSSSSQQTNASTVTWIMSTVIAVLTQELELRGDHNAEQPRVTDPMTTVRQYVKVLRRCFMSREERTAPLEHLKLEVPHTVKDEEFYELKDRLRAVVSDVDIVRADEPAPISMEHSLGFNP